MNSQHRSVIFGVGLIGLIAAAVYLWRAFHPKNELAPMIHGAAKQGGMNSNETPGEGGGEIGRPSANRHTVTSAEAQSILEPAASKELATPDSNDQDSFENRLDAISASFLTENPDFQSLARLWDEIGANASIVSGSIAHEGSKTTGEFALPNCNIRGQFQVENGAYRVEIGTPLEGGNETAFLRRTVTLSFRDKGGIASNGGSVVQYHPDTRRNAAEELRNGTEKLLGWSVSYREGRVQASPVTAWLADNGQSWAIGKSQRRSPIDATYGADGRAEQALLNVLGNAIR